MSVFNNANNKQKKEQESENESQSSEDGFISVCQLYNEKMMRQEQTHKRMDMIYNYMVKNSIKIEKKNEVKEEKVRKTRKDKEGRKYICGQCKLGYLSYPALYTHIKTKHDGITPDGTIRGESGKPKKRGRPKVRKAPQIYERELQKNELPKELSGLVSKDALQILQQFDQIQAGEDDVADITLKYFLNIARDLKKIQNTRLYLLPIKQIITVFLQNIKEYVAETFLQDFQETFFDLITYANKKYSHILGQHQLISRYYIDYDLKQGEVYCEVQRPAYLPVIIQKFMRTQLTAEDQVEQTLLLDFCKWLYAKQLTQVKLTKEILKETIQK